MQIDFNNNNIKDSDVLLNFIYNEEFELAIEWLENRIFPKVEQSRTFEEVKTMNKFDTLKFRIDKENHLISDKDNIIKFQSGKYKWESFIPKGKFVKAYKSVYWGHGHTNRAMSELEKKFFYRDQLVQWILHDLFHSDRISMDIFHIHTPKESISILKNDKITMNLTHQHKYYKMKVIEKTKHKMTINWILNEIRKVTPLRESEVMDLLEEKRKQSSKEWDEKEGIIEFALERGVDLTTFKTIGELIVGEASIEDIMDSVDIKQVSLDEFYPIFESNSYEEEEKTELFDAIVDEIDISKNFVGLLHMITHFRENIDYWGYDYRYEALESLYSNVLSNFPEILMDKFPELLNVLNFPDSPQRVGAFSYLIGKIKETEIMKKHFSLIEDEFKKLIRYFYSLPDYLGKEAPTKSDIFYSLEETVKGTELLRKEIPNFSKLTKFWPSYFEYDLGDFEAHFLVTLYSLLEGLDLMKSQYSFLINMFEIYLDKFDEIQKDEDVFNLFSLFYEALKQKKHTLTEEALMKKISKFTTNLSVIKKRFPVMWEEYEKNPEKIPLTDTAVMNESEDSSSAQKIIEVFQSEVRDYKTYIPVRTLSKIVRKSDVESSSDQSLGRGEITIQCVLENTHFTYINLPSTVVDKLFQDKRFNEIEKLKLFSKIVDEIDLSKNFNELIRLIEYFSNEYDYSRQKFSYRNYKIFYNSGKIFGDNQMLAFEYIYNAIIEAGNDVRRIPTRQCPNCRAISTSWNKICFSCKKEYKNFPEKTKNPTSLIMKRLPELLKVFEGYNYRLSQYTVFGSMISIINDSEVIAKHRTLIEYVLDKLLDNWYQLPEDLGKKYISKEGLFSELVRGIETTDLLEHKIPYFSKLVDVIPWDGPMYMAPNKFYLLFLIGLIEGKPITANQWSDLLWVFENMIDNFDIIQKDKYFIQVFNAASSIINVLLQKKPDLIKQTFVSKISLFTANLEAIQKNFPKIWADYEKICSVSKLHSALYSGEIADSIELLNTTGFEDFIKQIYTDPAKNLDIIKNIIAAEQDSDFLNSINIWTVEDELNEYELKLLREFTTIIRNWKNKDYRIPEIDFLEEIRNNTIKRKQYPPYHLRNLSRTELLAGVYEGETEEALLIKFGGGREIWVPKSTIHSSYDSKITTSQMFEVDFWIAKKNNLI